MSAPRSIGVFFCPDRARFGQNSVKEECANTYGTFLFCAGGSTEGCKPFVPGAGAQLPARVKGSRPFGTR